MRSSRAPDSRRTPIGSRSWAGTALARFFPYSRSAMWQRQSSIWWSRPLESEWERYLRQQIELGGSEIVLSEPGSLDHTRHPERSEGSLRVMSGRDLEMTSAQPIPRAARDDARVLVAEPS